MRKLKNLKHIFIITTISLTLLFGSVNLLPNNTSNIVNGFFTYRSGSGTWQEYIYKHTLSPNTREIKLVTIDDATLDYYQSKSLELNKEEYRKLVERLEGAGVKGIAIDIIFGDADNNGQNLEGKTKEEAFSEVLGAYSNIVIATQYDENYCRSALDKLKKDHTGTGKTPLDTTSNETMPGIMECNKQLGGIIGHNYDALDATEKTRYEQFYALYAEKKRIIAESNGKIQKYPIELLSSSGAAANFRTLFCQKDQTGSTNVNQYESCLNVPRSVYRFVPWGIINIDDVYTRDVRMEISDMPYSDWKRNPDSNANNYIYTLPLALYKITGGDISKYTKEKMLNPYFGRENSYPSISMKDVLLMSRVDLLKTFADTYVIIGDARQTNHDFVKTPVTGNDMLGMELHANFLDGLLQDKMLTELPENIMWGCFIGLLIVTILFYYFLPAFLSPILTIALTIGIIWGSRYLYDIHRIVVDILNLFIAGIITLPVTFSYRFFIVDKEKRYIENAFSHYIDPKMVKMIDAEETKVALGGEERDVSVFFSDIAGFTSISERLPPRELFWLMIHYLSRMTGVLKKQGGTLDKYIGDAVMGFFGAPVNQSDHAARACKTAIAMKEALPDLNREIAEHGLPKISFRIGIASGKVMVGNIGSEEHFNYTVLGDTVNLASRLEACGKEYDVHIIVSEGTYSQVENQFEFRELDTIAVKGKNQGIKIYELLGVIGSGSLDLNIHTNYKQALRYYRSGKYMEAGKIWESQMNIDGPSRVMALRCVEVLQGRVKVENGIYHMEHK